MITRKLKILTINEPDFIQNKVINYSYAFRFAWKSVEEADDSNYISKFKSRFNLTDIEYRSLISSVKAKKTAFQTTNENKQDKINDLTKSLENDSKLSKRDKFKIFRKIAFLKRSIENDIVFGNRSLLQQITREYNKGINKDIDKLNCYLNEYRYNRNNIPFFIVGESNQKGNRFFDFKDINNGLVIYKPFRGKKMEIKFKLSKSIQSEFDKLVELSENKSISISILLNNEYIYFAFDEEILNGYSLNEVERRIEVKEIKKQGYSKDTEKNLIKEIYKKYYDEQRERKLIGKIKDRCVSIDLNPTNIGFSILEKGNSENGYKIIHCGWFDLSKLCIKSGKSNTDIKSKYLNNKRKYELTIILKKLFNIAIHYKCSQFIMEDLSGNFKNNNKETNRKVKNIWNRELIQNIITRRCNQNGIELIKVNPIYSSFIGNIQHKYIDAVNASIEIGRRGLYKYESGMFYPHISKEDLSTMEAKFGVDVLNDTLRDWVQIYKFLKDSFNKEDEFSYRLRTALDDLVDNSYLKFSMSSYKSKTNYIKFNIV